MAKLTIENIKAAFAPRSVNIRPHGYDDLITVGYPYLDIYVDIRISDADLLMSEQQFQERIAAPVIAALDNKRAAFENG